MNYVRPEILEALGKEVARQLGYDLDNTNYGSLNDVIKQTIMDRTTAAVNNLINAAGGDPNMFVDLATSYIEQHQVPRWQALYAQAVPIAAQAVAPIAAQVRGRITGRNAGIISGILLLGAMITKGNEFRKWVELYPEEFAKKYWPTIAPAMKWLADTLGGEEMPEPENVAIQSKLPEPSPHERGVYELLKMAETTQKAQDQKDIDNYLRKYKPEKYALMKDMMKTNADIQKYIYGFMTGNKIPKVVVNEQGKKEIIMQENDSNDARNFDPSIDIVLENPELFKPIKELKKDVETDYITRQTDLLQRESEGEDVANLLKEHESLKSELPEDVKKSIDELESEFPVEISEPVTPEPVITEPAPAEPIAAKVVEEVKEGSGMNNPVHVSILEEYVVEKKNKMKSLNSNVPTALKDKIHKQYEAILRALNNDVKNIPIIEKSHPKLFDDLADSLKELDKLAEKATGGNEDVLIDDSPPPPLEPKGGKKEKKKLTAWQKHVKAYASEHGIRYFDALKKAKATYKAK